ncbi:MAG: cytochrome c family protein [Pyrinomonadaceae bacterium MAG19_C2-C3]|nr:cytochrome c family protein [Pyrinomonadaceae bacterium MAG19_C2-C3]
MKTLIVLIAFVAYGAIHLTGFASSFNVSPVAAPIVDSKVQPKGEIKLAKDSKHETWGEVAFNHETHSLKNYNIEGTGVIACIECHHTDQPGPKPPYKTFERKVALTTASLEAGSEVVKSCRTCHFQEDSGKKQPTLTYEGESDPTELTNTEAYHRNCNTCHEAVKAKRPAANAPATCDTCHVKKA